MEGGAASRIQCVAPAMVSATLGSASVDSSARSTHRGVAPAGGTLYYRGHSFQPLKGSKSRANFQHTKTGEPYRFCACSHAKGVVEIDDDVREEYWTEMRHEPKRVKERFLGPAP